jgi:hypothetical protein
LCVPVREGIASGCLGSFQAAHKMAHGMMPKKKMGLPARWLV